MVPFFTGVDRAWDVLMLPQVREVIHRVGYAVYFLVILGVWKLLGSIAMIIPRFPRLKEWAYAGVVFNLTGARIKPCFWSPRCHHGGVSVWDDGNHGCFVGLAAAFAPHIRS